MSCLQWFSATNIGIDLHILKLFCFLVLHADKYTDNENKSIRLVKNILRGMEGTSIICVI